jgi:DNA-binding SARP family transcriptional activator/tetratricopeptide (TPR) repeat protein
VRVRLLGPVDVIVAGTPKAVSGLRRRAVLATLALQPGHIVTTDRLIDIVWGDDPPATAVNTLQRHISYLRAVFGARSAIVARSPGYLLDTGVSGETPECTGEATDVEVVRRLLRQSGQADPAERVSMLRAAAALWRGPALADVTGVPWLDQQAAQLAELRLDVVRALVDARLAIGEHAQILEELVALAREQPLDERIHAQLMLAQYRAGRQADALATFRRLRQTLDEELGVEPGQPVRKLQAAILRQDASIDALPSAAGTTAVQVMRAAPIPAQLPAAVSAFIGRTAELSALDSLLPATEADGPAGRAVGPAAMAIAAVSGTAGVGKTALTLRWANRVAGRFPDGQLYVNLRGFDPGGPATDPAEVLHGFLVAFGVPAARVPPGRDDRTGLFRSVLAGKRVLVVLDNARDVDQVRPLLPGSPGCLVVVTSRNQLTSLVVTGGARPLVLDLPSPDEARDLFAHRIDGHRLAADPGAVDEIVERCARLPLALAIAAARAAVQPGLPLTALAGQLRDSADRLATLRGGDRATDLCAVFSWSYRRLSAEAARLFRLLGLHPGPDIGSAAAASLLGVPTARARQLLAELTAANLLSEHRPGRYACHDLLRAYAAERAAATGPAAHNRAALSRVLDYYLHTGYAATLALHPPFSQIELPPCPPDVRPTPIGGRAEATAWFTAELSVLLAAVSHAAGSGFEAVACRLAWTMTRFLDCSGHWSDWLAVHWIALDAATRIEDLAAQEHAHRDLGRAFSRQGRQDEATRHLRQALALSDAVGDQTGRAHTHLNLGQAAERQGRLRAALDHSQQALALFQRSGHLAGEAYALNVVGWQLSLLGDHHRALASCEQAVHMLRQVGDMQGEADAWDSLGYANHQLGRHRQAISCYENAVRLFQQHGDQYAWAATLRNIGDTNLALGDPIAARTAWRRALTVLAALGHPDADEVRANLTRLVDEGPHTLSPTG